MINSGVTINISVIIVTHNSESVIDRCISTIFAQQGINCRVIIVDSGSEDSSYLNKYEKFSQVSVIQTENVGFSRANNIGYQHLNNDESYVVFLNPDVFLESNTFHNCLNTITNKQEVACVTGKIYNYDLERGHSLGNLDSTGIFRKWYGKWYDRGQGEKDVGKYDTAQYLPAACGAFLFCRKSAIDYILLDEQNVFDPDFFLYKEDIELSIRLRSNGFRIYYDHLIKLSHCRGWNKKRTSVPYHLKIMSSENEVILYCKHKSVYILWALFKYILVRVFRV